MVKLLALTIIATLGLLSCSDNDNERYDGSIIPYSIGNSWQYGQVSLTETGDTLSAITITETVIDSLYIGDTLCYVVSKAVADVSLREELIARIDDKIYRLAVVVDGDTARLEPPQMMVKYPVRFAEKFFADTVSNALGGVDSVFWAVTNLAKRINTPAGSFQCVEYYSHLDTYSIDGDVVDTFFNETRLYLKPEVGIIRIEEAQNRIVHTQSNLIEYNLMRRE